MDRRDFLKKLSVTGMITFAGAVGIGNMQGDDSTPSATEEARVHSPDCILTPEQTPGPFYFNANQVRSNLIMDDHPGMPLQIILHIVNATDPEVCEPISDAVVDIWHTDAQGLYSGYTRQGDNFDIDTTDEDFLRAIQVTDSDGKAAFTTIYPGWYPGRVPHIHFKIHLDDITVVTSQLYFPAAISEEIFGTPLYTTRSSSPITFEEDVVINPGGRGNQGTDDIGTGDEFITEELTSLMMTVEKIEMDDEQEQSTDEGYIAMHTIGIALDSTL